MRSHMTSAICGSEALPPFQGLKYGGGPDPGVSPLANDCRRSAAKADMSGHIEAGVSPLANDCRRSAAKAVYLIACLFAGTSAALAADKVQMDEPAKKAVARGLEWLASKQNSDG